MTTNPNDFALSFDGVDDTVEIGTHPDHKIAREITVEAWVRVASQKTWAGLVSRVFDTGSTESGYGLLLDGASGVHFALKVPGQAFQYLSSGTDSVPPSEWHHVAGTWDGKTMRVYVDGAERATRDMPADTIEYIVDQTLRMGAYADDDEKYFFHGQLGEVRLWSVALDAETLRRRMNARLTGAEDGLVGHWPVDEGRGDTTRDASRGGHAGAIAGATWVPVDKPKPPPEVGDIYVSPVLNVSDVAASVRWFEALGWKRQSALSAGGLLPDGADADASGPAIFATMRAGYGQVFLYKDGQGLRGGKEPGAGGGDDVGATWQVWRLKDRAALDEVLRRAAAADVRVIAPPEDRPWGEREARLSHPDGHVIRLSAPLAG